MNDTLIVPTAIQNLDLSTARERLLQKKGWTAEYADRLIEEYREYLALFYFHPGEELVPPASSCAFSIATRPRSSASVSTFTTRSALRRLPHR
jgi:hypothetical protein